MQSLPSKRINETFVTGTKRRIVKERKQWYEDFIRDPRAGFHFNEMTPTDSFLREALPFLYLLSLYRASSEIQISRFVLEEILFLFILQNMKLNFANEHLIDFQF